MNRVALAFLTKDRVELSRRTVEPLLQPDKFDLFWIDGSKTREGQWLPTKYVCRPWVSVEGGADAAIVHALTTLLNFRPAPLKLKGVPVEFDPVYDFVGLCENDVLLDPDWFDPTMGLFIRGAKDGLAVGAVSARAYEDRVLLQRDGFAVMHNLGAGMVIFTREAAQLILDNYRTGMTSENVRTFATLSGVDIRSYWAFRQSDHWITADWQWDRILAEHGLASLALTPCKATMIGQDPPLEQQGLALVKSALEMPFASNDEAFERFCRTTADIRTGNLKFPSTRFHRDAQGYTLIFPHQLPQIGGSYSGDWTLKWSQGFGPFAWRAGQEVPWISVETVGPTEFLFLGASEGGEIDVNCNTVKLSPEASGTVESLHCPGGKIDVQVWTPGVCFYGLRTRDPQPWFPNVHFDHAALPPVGG